MKDLGNIEVIEGRCKECLLYLQIACDENFTALTGLTCAEQTFTIGKILKKKEQWVQCTSENTKVGDVVRLYGVSNKLRTVDYIFRSADRLLLSHDVFEFEEINVAMSDYEIQVKE